VLRACEAACELTATPASASPKLDFQGMGKSTAMMQGRGSLGETKKAGMRVHTGLLIAVSFHRLFLGGLLPSRARFRFAGCCDGIRRDRSPSSRQQSGA
jgi:hypothetical protein